MSVLLLDSIVDKHAIDIEADHLKMIKVSCIFVSTLVWPSVSHFPYFYIERDFFKPFYLSTLIIHFNLIVTSVVTGELEFT
jgi:hypothetical protein